MAGITVSLRPADLARIRGVLEKSARQAMTSALVLALTRGAILIEGRAKRRCPVRTGRLRANIAHTPVEAVEGRLQVRVGTNVEYARFVEFGTGRRGAASGLTQTARGEAQELGYRHGRRAGMRAQPFLFPAFEESRDDVAKFITQDVAAALERVR